jgi:hypothetical protein
MSKPVQPQTVSPSPFPRVVYETDDEQFVELSASYNNCGTRGDIRRLEALFDKVDAGTTVYQMQSYREPLALVLNPEELEALFIGYLRFLTTQEMFITDSPIQHDPLVQAFTAYIQANKAYQATLDEAVRRFNAATASSHS